MSMHELIALLSVLTCILFIKMMNDFCDMTGVDEESVISRWKNMSQQLRKYVQLETKKAVRQVLEKYNQVPVEDSNEGEGEQMNLMDIHEFL